MRPGTLLLIATMSIAARPGIAADAMAGKAIFGKCRICHAVEAGRPSPVGPNLHGIFGRKAGVLDGFAYSAAMKQSAVVWGDDTLAEYVHDPKGFIPGNRMAFPGIESDREIADLLAYLHQATQ